MSQQTALLLAGGISLASVVQACVGPQIVFWLIRSGMRWQAGSADLIYQKVPDTRNKVWLFRKNICHWTEFICLFNII